MSIRHGDLLYEFPSCKGEVLEVQVIAFASITHKGLTLIRNDGFIKLRDGARMRCRRCGKEAEEGRFVAPNQRELLRKRRE